MSNIKTNIETILRNYTGAYISSSGTRTIEDQMYYVTTRPAQYPKTLRLVFKDFNLDNSKFNDAEFLKTVYKDRQSWLKETILKLAKEKLGFNHLSGHAVDVSVRALQLETKKKLLKQLEAKGYNVILETGGSNSKYYVPISQANVFHIDLLTISAIEAPKNNNNFFYDYDKKVCMAYGKIYDPG